MCVRVAQLRSRVVTSLRGDAVDVAPAKGVHVSGAEGLQYRVCTSMIADFLRFVGLQHTLSVFIPEAGVGGAMAMLSRTEMLQSMGVHRSGKLHARLERADKPNESEPATASTILAAAVEVLRPTPLRRTRDWLSRVWGARGGWVGTAGLRARKHAQQRHTD